MNDETKATAQDNIQSVLNGDMDGAAYMIPLRKHIQSATKL